MGPAAKSMDLLNRTYRPDLLTLARQARALSQTELGRLAGLSQPTVSRLEEHSEPSAEQLSKLSDALGMPCDFFFIPEPVYGFGVGELFHRRRKTISAKNLNRIHAQVNLHRIAAGRLLKAVDLPPVDLPVADERGDAITPEAAARALRSRWLLPPGPIASVSETLEAAGILVIPVDFRTSLVDAIGQWAPQLPPIIFVNPSVTQDRLRFSLMHEVGHFVLHAGWGLDLGPSIEEEADRFASEFLVPEYELKQSLPKISLMTLAHLKRHWKVSMAALLYRATALGTISRAQAERLWTEMGKLGYRKREPEQFDVFCEDLGVTFREVLRLHLDDLGYSVPELARMVSLNEAEFSESILGRPVGLRLVG